MAHAITAPASASASKVGFVRHRIHPRRAVARVVLPALAPHAVAATPAADDQRAHAARSDQERSEVASDAREARLGDEDPGVIEGARQQRCELVGDACQRPSPQRAHEPRGADAQAERGGERKRPGGTGRIGQARDQTARDEARPDHHEGQQQRPPAGGGDPRTDQAHRRMLRC